MSNFHLRFVKLASGAVLFGAMLNAHSAITDLANAPLITSPTSSVLPNVFLMMDDSGSMAWDYMPDNAGNFASNAYGAATSQCNGVFYDPTITYSPPVTATGATYANSSFTAAWVDGFNTAGGTTNLSTSFQPVGGGGGAGAAAYYYTYSGAQTTDKLKDYYNTSSTFYRECNSNVGATPGSSVFTKKVVTTATEQQNFANWYSYYRTRINMMKTATGRAFSPISTTFRVGFATINNNTTADLLQLNTFDATQKAAWYAKLYAAVPGNSTPLREALADVGRMYANKLPASNPNNALTSAVVDPIQFSCQQNFTILTTDGFWNGSTTYNLSGGTVGNQDYFEPRPLYDGSNVSSTTTTPYTTVQQRQTVTSGSTTTNTWSKTTTSIGAACSSTAPSLPNNCIVGNSSQGTNSRTWCLEANQINGSECTGAIGTGNQIFSCRGTGSTNNLPGGVDSACRTDSSGTKWCLFTSNTVSGTNSCVSNGYNLYICAVSPTVSGNLVTTTPYTQTETISGSTSTVVNAYTASQQTTQTTTNGIVGAVSALSPSTLSYVANAGNPVSSSSTAATSDVFGAWTAGTASTVCTATASLPAAGTSTPAITATSATGGTANTTILSTTGPTAGTPTTTGSSSGGTSDTLADVAEYYYITDLRTPALGNNLSGAAGTVNGTDISANNVPSSGLDAASNQHMTTFTLGLGARGRMVFDPAYNSATSGDFYAVKQGSTATSSVCSWQTSNTSCNWPIPSSNAIENVDDLWHAAVDGRGTYFSAGNPTGLATALSSALAGVSARTGAAAAATTSNAFVTQGDNFLFRSTFVSQQWSGELIRQQLDVVTGAVLTTIDWSAQSQLDANAARNIYFYNASATNKLSAFNSTNLSAAGLSGYFNWSYISSTATPTLSQFCAVGATCLPTWAASTTYTPGSIYKNGSTWYKVNTAYTSGTAFGTTDTANTSVISPADTTLISFLTGDRTNEGPLTDLTKFYRQRTHVLGDIVNSETTYVRGGLSPSYADPGYASFASSMSDRQAMVYVGANDGMLHAFYATSGMMSGSTGHLVASGGTNVSGGQEAWAFIPTAVIPNLYKLADKNYSNLHQYFVDGSPVAADICISNCTVAGSAVWKTILIGGLNDGGASYYALDITNPAQPVALWQFTDANMGFTYGNPKVVKLKTGQWVVLLSSGYNNTAGDGQGHLYVLDAYTGASVRSIATGVGSAASPSGLGRLDAPLASPGIDSTAQAVYAGDMQGNVWRFDVNGDLGATSYDAQLLATLRGAAGNVQPITTKPLLSYVGNSLVVYVGTGRYLGSTDLADTSSQSMYAIKDPLCTTYQTVNGVTSLNTACSNQVPSTALYGNPRTNTSFVAQGLTATTCPVGSPSSICTAGQNVITSTASAVNFASKNGWYLDFPAAGERVNVDPAIINGTLIVNTNVPNASSCSVGGNSFQYQFNYATGGAVSSSTTGVIGTQLGNELATRPVIATLSNGQNIAYTQGSGGSTPKASASWSNGNSGNVSTVNGAPARKAWRQLIQQ